MPPRIFFTPGAMSAGQAPWKVPLRTLCCTSVLPFSSKEVSAVSVYDLARSPLNEPASLASGQLDLKL